MKVIRQIEWDMAHRLANHDSKCRNLHGHRYKAEICVEGDLVAAEGASAEGMVVDFGDIKKITREQVEDVLDHGVLVWEKDKLLSDFFKKNPSQKHLVVPFTTTSENIAAWIFLQLDKRFEDKYGVGLKLYSVKLWETPKNVVICNRQDAQKMAGKKYD